MSAGEVGFGAVLVGIVVLVIGFVVLMTTRDMAVAAKETALTHDTFITACQTFAVSEADCGTLLQASGDRRFAAGLATRKPTP